MRTNLLRDRIQVQIRTVSEGALGQTVVWKPVQYIYGRVVPLDAKSVAAYQQLGSSVSHKIISARGVTLNLADYRFKHLNKTYAPASPPITLADNESIAVSEV